MFPFRQIVTKLFTLLLVMVVCATNAHSQEKSKQPEEKPNLQNTAENDTKEIVRKKFLEIQTLAKKGDWEKFRKTMTNAAADEFCYQQILSAISIHDLIDMIPYQVDSLLDAGEEVNSVFDDYKINPRKIHSPVVGSNETMMAKDMEKTSKEDEESKKKILQRLNKTGKRWEIIGKLFNIQPKANFSFNPFNGSILSIKVPKKNVAFVLVNANKAPKKKLKRIRFQLKTPPYILRFEKDAKNSWLFKGIDDEKTSEEIDKHNEKRRKARQKNEEKTDAKDP